MRQHGSDRAAARLATSRDRRCAAERAGEPIREHDPVGQRRATGKSSALIDAGSTAAVKTNTAATAAGESNSGDG
jgi:hypothetical protein